MRPVIAVADAPTHNTSMDVDQQKVDQVLKVIHSNGPATESQLADALRNPNLTQAERDQIIQTLAREANGPGLFYCNDAERMTRGDDGLALSEDQKVVADALQKAYDDGAINQQDLLRIADAKTADNGPQPLMAMLREGNTTTGPNGIAEVLADGLWARNHGSDRAVAAIFYTSDPAMMSRNLNTADKRAEAFEALVDFNAGNPYSHINESTTRTIWQHSALNAEGRLFTAYSQELVDRYTGQDGSTVHTEPLAKFMSQTLFNPGAQGIWMNRSQDLVPAIRTALGNVAQTYLDRSANAPNNSLQQTRAMQQFGRLTASVTGGAALALTTYDGEIMANEQSKQQFCSMVSSVINMTPLGSALDKIPAGGGSAVVDALAGKLFDAITSSPKRPDAALAGVLYDRYDNQAEQVSNQTGVNLSTYFESGYAAEVLNLEQNLNVNLGGHSS